MRKPSTTALRRRGKLQDGQLTIGLDLGDRSSFYCVLNGAGEVVRLAFSQGRPKTWRQIADCWGRGAVISVTV